MPYPDTRINWQDLGLVPTSGLAFWHTYEAGISGNGTVIDYSGNDRHIVAAGTDPVLQSDVTYGQPAWYFDGSTTDPLTWSGPVTLRHYFVLAAHDGAAFDQYRGLMGGATSGDVLVSNDSGTDFFNLGFTGFTYRKSGVTHPQSDQEAPMARFELIEVIVPAGIGLDGIQVGAQRNLAGRIWKGWWVEHMGFTGTLNETRRRKVLLYYALRYGVHLGSDVPLYFPSSDLVEGPILNRFYPVPRDWDAITEDYEFEDTNKTFNEFAADPPRRWQVRYVNVSKAQAGGVFDVFDDTARRATTFFFRDPDGRTWNNVQIENYQRNHDAHKRWVHTVDFDLVGYDSTYTPDPIPEGPPMGFDAEAVSESEILLTWDAPLDEEAPTAPVLTSAVADSDTAITMIWAASTDNVGVTGYQTRIDGGSWVNRGNVLTYQYTGLTAATEYDFEVRAYDAAGNFSAASNLISETTDAVPSVSPDDISGLVLWLAADELSLADNDPVASWTDLSGNDYHATEATNRPTYKTNQIDGLPVVRFDGTNDQLTTPSITGLGAWTVYIVAKNNDTDDAYVLDASDGGHSIISEFVAGKFSQFTSGTVLADTSTTDFVIVKCTVGTTTTGTWKIGQSGGTNFWGADCAEIIVYDHVLSGGDQTLVENYLAVKYPSAI